MEKRKNHLSIFLIVIFIVATIHSAAYVINNLPSNISSTTSSSISGLSIKKTPENQIFSSLSSLSEIFIILEWIILILGAVFFVLKQKIDLRKEIINLYITKKY